jgi:Spy/CpxP family protein refolding chaperone
MRTVGMFLAVAILIIPVLATGQPIPRPVAPEEGTPFPVMVLAQGPGGFGPPLHGDLQHRGPVSVGPPPPMRPIGPGPGMWWKDSDTVKKLDLSETQKGQLEQTFLEHRLRLVDLRADLEKRELGLEPLLDVDRPDETKVSTQIDLITAARGRLEKEHALLRLAIRRVLTTDQWRQVQALQQERARRIHGGPPAGPPSGSGPFPGRQVPPPATQ